MDSRNNLKGKTDMNFQLDACYMQSNTSKLCSYMGIE